MYKFSVELEGQKRNVVVINHKGEDDLIQPVVETTTVQQLHHIHILDRSGSMSGHINNLIDNVIDTLDVIDNNDLITIIWFASAGQYRTLVKGAKKSDKLVTLLNTLRSTIGCTCFSDPLREANTIIDELTALCPNISVTLFTDGEPVVPWSVDEEIRRIFKELNIMKANIVAFNTIGYGNWYNRDLLMNMARCSEFGEFVHASMIDDYLDIFEHNFAKVTGQIIEGIEVKAPICEVMYLTREFTKITNGEMKLSRTDKRKNQFFLIGEDAKDFSFEYQGDVYNSKDIIQIPPLATMENFYYAYAYNMYNLNKRRVCLEILGKIVCDKYLVDRQMASFTYDECSGFLAELNSALTEPKFFRFVQGKCSTDYIPKDDAPCVLDVLKILQEGEALYLPFSENVDSYQRITRKTEDTFNLFNKTKEEVTAPFSDFVYNKSHMNLSILFYIPGTVKLNSISAKKVGLPSEIKSGMFRNHTIIKDGVLNMKKIAVKMNDETTDKLKNLLGDTYSITVNTYDEEAVINLVYLPIINRKYVEETNIGNVFQSVKNINTLEASQKVVKYYLDKVMEEGASTLKKQGALADYTMAQIKVLEEHGLDKNLNYAGVEKVTKSKEESDSYMTRLIEFGLVGVSSLPKVEDVLNKISEGKSLTISQSLIAKADENTRQWIDKKNFDIDKPSTKLRDLLQEMLSDIKKRLVMERAKLNAMKMSLILTGDWFPGLVPNDKGEYLYTENDVTMVAKVKYEVVYF